MQIKRFDNTNFTSLKNPVKCFYVNTPKGKLYVEEVRLSKKNPDDAMKVSEFFNKNFIDGSSDPLWKEYLLPYNKKQFEEKNKRYASYLTNIFEHDDGNTTLLLARDYFNKIRGAVFSQTYNDPESLYDKKLCNIEALAVEKDYRHSNLGKSLMEKTMRSAKNAFTDAVLTGYNKAVPFYKKLGFKVLPKDTKQKKYFYKELQKERDDIPTYTQIMYKPLQEKSQRFYDRIDVKSRFSEFISNLKQQITG